ncbi:protein serine/threonine phosphatase PrpC regulation of stationary phase [Clostridium sp. CAG:793]|jgi:serine/threonine protein phosphatase PrpC|nr:protein serine/threonine phosphatase PrpC regulation of stationary phase [Clostridium sp. CAG:793]
MSKAFATSDVGKAREINEDYFYISYPDDEIQLFILADGMGGYNGGEVASKLAVTSAKNYILSNFEKNNSDKDTILDLVKNSSQYANMVVYEKAKENPELSKMGTTLDICLIYQSKAFISHIGDSRIYRIRKDFMRKLTKDHSYVQQLIDEGKITKEESLKHPKKNMLMKALGCTPFIEPDAMIKGFIKEDVILMCSDGLTNMVSEERIKQIIKENPTDATKLLVQEANDNGGNDNITAIIIR